MRQLLWRTATSSYLITELIVSMTRCRIQGSSRSIQRLPNGNTLITESSFGRLFEVTREGEIVWEYVSPFFGKPLFGGREGSESNQVFRAYRYSDEEIARARRNG